MSRPLLILLLLAPAVASAEIYRWVDAEGAVSYSDRPQPGAAPVGLPGKPRAPNSAPKSDNPATAAPSAETPLLGPYRSFEIVSPEANQTVRQDDGKLPVSLIVDPPLIVGHRVELVVDGAPISVDKAGTQLVLTGVTYGSHRAQAQIRDAENAVVARTAPVAFHLRKPIPPGFLQAP
jgi:hypothetical protein